MIIWFQNLITMKPVIEFIRPCPLAAACLVAVTQIKLSTVLAFRNLFQTEVSH